MSSSVKLLYLITIMLLYYEHILTVNVNSKLLRKYKVFIRIEKALHCVYALRIKS